MPGPEILLDPVDFVTVGTVGPKGRREFYLQAGKGAEIVTMLIEKQQAQALSEAVDEILENLKDQFPEVPETTINLTEWDMDLRKPIQSLFRVAQMGLGYDEARDLIVLVAQELGHNTRLGQRTSAANCTSVGYTRTDAGAQPTRTICR